MKRLYFFFLCLFVATIPAIAQKKNAKTDTLMVYGNCIQCKERIEKTLNINGISKADWGIDTKILTVTFDSTKLNIPAIQQKLAAAGHDSKTVKATEVAYNKLPSCCKYEREPIASIPTINSAATQHTVNTNSLITGVVLQETQKGNMLPIVNATVSLLGMNNTVASDSLGVFRIKNKDFPAKIIVRYVGFIPDTLSINNASDIKVILKDDKTKTLKEVTVTSGRPFSAYVSTLSTLNTLNIGSKEIAKAACCNLSESFETTPSVDVSYSDAVTGVKQIQLLGLSGNYTQITTENIPEIRGLAGAYGLTFVPGPWLESVQVTKGTGSVANGYESIAGQINIEEKKPDKAEKLLVNGYANMLGRLETSVNYTQKLNDRWATTLLTHANITNTKTDDNKDGFLDVPIGHQLNLINRWRYIDNKGLIAQFGIKALADKRQAGETDFNPNNDKLTTNKYGVGIDVAQYEAFGKLGYVFSGKKYKSIGFIFSAKNYTNNAYYGLTKYDGRQSSLYANLIYQSIIGTTEHKFRTGLSFSNDNYNETFASTIYKRVETVPGAFFEYTFTPTDKFTAILGLREDYHNQFGFITTPRLHLKYDITKTTNLRFSAGSGFRVANIFAENTGLFVSSRQYNILNPTNNYGYSLDPEKAWNYGINLSQQFTLNKHKGAVSIDAYRTDFKNQVIADVDANPQQINFYNLNGKSYSNSVQAEVNYELLQRFDLRLAYRWLDVQTTYHGILMEKPLTARHRAFANLAYETANHFKFDFTTQWFSSKRLPNTAANPVGLQMPANSPAYFQLSAQITKQWGKTWELYVGGENLANYKQEQLFIDNTHPFSPYFDGSMVWGPVNGRMLYVGVRFKVL
ncbi:TonB-dependent receptor domain-containing protein [Parasediminibacterium sp. JCM 36343]|uniref:TonB-dependent receptor domain-containing protein n=1 Tax=Parasediminibacterium sp. JCM 36343 TaxID=3374279 RepID=UPI00397BC2DB